MTYASFKKKIAVYLLGVSLFPFGLSICAITNIGLAPWDVLAQGLGYQLNIGLGSAGIIVSFIVLTIAAFLKIIPGIGTFFNIIVIGLLIDFMMPLISNYLNLPDNYLVLIPTYIIGLIFMSIGGALYMIVRFGAGPRDSLILGVVEKFKIRISYVKPVIEAVVLVVGIYFGGVFGVGTIINLLLMGQIIDIVFRIAKFDPREVKQYNIIEQYSFIKRYFSKQKNNIS